MDKMSSSHAVAEIVDTQRKVKKLQTKAANMAERNRSRRQQEVVYEIGLFPT